MSFVSSKDYFDIVKKPMDLSTIKKKLDQGQYSEPWEYVDDINQMFDNGWLYNRKTSRVYKFATKVIHPPYFIISFSSFFPHYIYIFIYLYTCYFFFEHPDSLLKMFLLKTLHDTWLSFLCMNRIVMNCLLKYCFLF